MAQNWDQLDYDEKQRAFFLGTRNLIPSLNELVAYFDGQLSDHVFSNLKWNLKIVKSRPQMTDAYRFLKDGYPKDVQNFWEELESYQPPSVADAN